MSYPHTIHRAQRHNIFLAWCQVLPGVIVNCVLLGLIVYGIQKCINWNEIRKARRSGLSRSYSANTF
ncbi:hypothetical protein OESDEN_18253 [Oesophagostomum dentatum]|uniref:Uncharacterized protein n=1 Tax=Oesophagostomum dentatum TaxID=61180 RepID=A0A0B1SDU1_OESDE|nr:hypothetical protein OESDEN_18253 [Oesophagostomum dentatum]